jgi:hypothetical protein
MVDHYTGPMAKMSAATKAFAQPANDIKASIGNVAGVFGMIALPAVGAATAIGAFANSASEAAASFDTMERTFAGALGGIEQGAQAMSYLESYSKKSAFGLEDLARASAQLAASGLDVGRFLPIIERFALVASGTDPQGLIQVAGALARIKGGSFGEAMEVFRKAGVGANDLRGQGIKVTKAGEIQAQSGEVFDAVQRISEGRIKKIADSISGGAENIRANVGDVAGQAFREIGKEVNKTLLPFLKDFTKEMDVLVKSKVIPLVTQQFLGLGGGLKAGSSVIEELFVALAQIPIRLKNFGESVGAIGDFFKALFQDDDEARQRYMKVFSGDGIAAFEMELKLSEQGIRNRFRKAREAPPEPPPEFPKVKEPEPDKQQDPVAKNTAKLVDLAQKSLDLQRQILGGGARAEEAASAVRIGAALGENSTAFTGTPEEHLLRFAAAMRKEAMGTELGMRRNAGQPNKFGRR